MDIEFNPLLLYALIIHHSNLIHYWQYQQKKQSIFELINTRIGY
jgi:hypothetical protein